MPNDTQNNLNEALRQIRSRNQDYRQQLNEQILQRSGLTKSNTVNALHYTPNASNASVAQSIYDNEDQNKVNYAAAWSGLLTKNLYTLVFHTANGGPDSLYKFHLDGSGDKVADTLNKYGLQQAVLLPSETGFHVILHDPQRSIRGNVEQLVKDVGINDIEETEGNSQFLGASDPAKSRDSYRDFIKKYETSSNQNQAQQ
jgi:hypothetical protein